MQLKSWFNRFPLWVYQSFKADKAHFCLIFYLVLVAFLLRFYNLSATLLFQSDQGRDALVVSHLIKKADLIFIGPVTSIGNMYLGPFYYYFMAPFLALSYPSPLGPAIGVALVNVALVFFIYYWGKALVGKTAATWACFFSCFSLVLIEYSRFSWNPNLSAFFSLLTLYALYLSLKRSSSYWFLVAIGSSILLQLHYVNLIILVVVGIFFLQDVYTRFRSKNLANSSYLKHIGIATLIFFVSLLPLMLFDYKNQGLNLKALMSIFTKEQSFSVGSGHTLGALFTGLSGKIGFLFTKLFLPKEQIFAEVIAHWHWYGVFFGVIILTLLFAQLFLKQQKEYLLGQKILLVTSVVSIFTLSAYQHSVFVHYVLFFLPVLFLLLGSLLAGAERLYRFGMLVSMMVVMVFLWANFRPNIYRPIEHGYQAAGEIARQLVASVPDGKKYSFVIHTNSHDTYGDYYRFFLEQAVNPPLSLADLENLDYLYVIDETKTANLNDIPTYEVVIARNSPTTLEELPVDADWVRVYRYTFGREKHE